MRSSSSRNGGHTDTRRRRLLAGAAVVAVLLVVGAVGLVVVGGGNDDGEVDPSDGASLPFDLDEGSVYAFDTEYHSVQPLQVAVGEKVTFDNRDSKPHTFTSDEGLFDSETVEPGKRYAYAYAAPGTFRYHCEIHPLMTGSLVVVRGS